MLSKITLDTFERTKGRIGNRLYEITKVSSEPAPSNYHVLGNWVHVIHDNVTKLESLMDKAELTTLDAQTTVPHEGMLYTVHVQVTNAQAKVGRNGQAKD